MRLSDRKLKKQLVANCDLSYRTELLQETIKKSRAAFAKEEALHAISYAEFLYTQTKYIQKRWWILQGALLLFLWLCLHLTGSNYYTQRCMGIAASLFAILLLPELWKNRNANALEIESASYYSLRQIYSARILAFSLVDLLLLGAFAFPVLAFGLLPARELILQFFLPYLVNCCICFRVLSSDKIGSENFSVILCIVFCAVWTQMVLSEKIYGVILLPVWGFLTGIAALYLAYCVYKEQHNCTKIWEANTRWN